MIRLLRPLLALILVSCAFASFAAPKARSAVPVEGRDFQLIPDGRPYRAVPGQVEVVEVFGYTCPYCASFEPSLSKWSRALPARARLVRVPASFGGYWDAYARAYFAAEALGVATRSHDAMFNALHRAQSLPVQNVTVDELAGFYAAYGIDAERFRRAYRAPEVDAQIERSREWITHAGVDGTPMLVVAGRYRVTATSREGVLRTARWLVDRELARGAR